MFEKYSSILDLIFQDFKIKSEVFQLFALLHDSKKENEYEDEHHGQRASIFAKKLLDDGLIAQ